MFSFYFSPRDEAASATVGNITFVLGGVGDNSIEFIDMTDYDLNSDDSLDLKSKSEKLVCFICVDITLPKLKMRQLN